MTQPAARRLSVVTISKDNADGLRRTLLSLREQDLTRELFEVLVIDSASSDGTDDVVRTFGDLPLIFVSEPDRGVYDAMNKGWRLASGDYFHFLNAGDRLSRPDSLSTALRAAREHRPSWLVFGATHHHGGQRPPSTIANLPHRLWPHALGRQPHCHQACWFSRELTVALGGYSEAFDFAGDFDFILRAGLSCQPLEIHDSLVSYEGGGLSYHRAGEIPDLLHRVRVARFQLTTLAYHADKIFTLGQRARHNLSRRRHLRR
jgi:glycosyltransferase involved in cell wall biosynthesis